MSNDKDVQLPEAQVDPDVDRAPGGADASPNESDVGSGERTNGDLVTPDQPLSAQQDEAEVPDQIQEPDDKDQTTDDSEVAEPEVEPSG